MLTKESMLEQILKSWETEDAMTFSQGVTPNMKQCWPLCVALEREGAIDMLTNPRFYPRNNIEPPRIFIVHPAGAVRRT